MAQIIMELIEGVLRFGFLPAGYLMELAIDAACFCIGWFVAYVIVVPWLKVYLVHVKTEHGFRSEKRFVSVFISHLLFSIIFVDFFIPLMPALIIIALHDVLFGIFYFMLLPVALECFFLRVIARWRILKWFRWQPPLKRVIPVSLCASLVAIGAGLISIRMFRISIPFAKVPEVNAKAQEETTPPQVAAPNDHAEVADVVGKYGARAQPSVLRAVERNNIDQVKALLDGGGYVDGKDRGGKTSLTVAAKKGQLEIAKLLLVKGADVNTRDNDWWTPLHYAADEGQLETAQLLLAHGADVNAEDKFGLTPLHDAARHGHQEVAQLLLTKGANLKAKDRFGLTPLHAAVREGHQEVVELLKKHEGK